MTDRKSVYTQFLTTRGVSKRSAELLDADRRIERSNLRDRQRLHDHAQRLADGKLSRPATGPRQPAVAPRRRGDRCLRQ